MPQSRSLSNSPRRKALFLDRDGVAIEYVPYLSAPEQVKIPPGAVEALRQWQASGYWLAIVTNQSGVGRGYFSLAEVEAVHQHVREEYGRFGITFDDIRLCPHHPEEGCPCRKPSPHMLLEAAKEHGISLTESYFAGDAASDLECAIAAGCQPLLILTGLGRETAQRLDRFSTKIPCFEGLADTVRLLGQPTGEKGR